MHRLASGSRTRLLVQLAFGASLFTGACDCGGGSGPTSCIRSSDCPGDEVCIDDLCQPRTTFDAGGDTSVPFDANCPAGRDSCGVVCCPDGYACMDGVCMLDCGDEGFVCGATCCDEGTQECFENTRCVVACDDEGQRCGADQNTCCADGTACLGESCIPLGDPCTFSEECALAEFCEPTLGRCVPRDSVEVCEFVPPPGEFTPQVGCQWRPPVDEMFDSRDRIYADVVMTPAVANLTDDNGDGVTDEQDIPDLVFISFDKRGSGSGGDGCCTAYGVMRVVSGLCEEDPDPEDDLPAGMTTLATFIAEGPGTGSSNYLGNSSGIALGNLHPAADTDEHAPEIVTTFQSTGTVAFRRTSDDGTTWEQMWRNDTYPTSSQSQAGAQPSLADLDQDGRPEVIVGNVVLDGLDGTLIWDGNATATSANPGIGNNAFLGPNATVADLDGDTFLEVIAGNTVYEGRTGEERWTFDYGAAAPSSCQGSLDCDGYNAVANMDDDPEGEVIIIRQGELFIIEHDGTLAHRLPIPVDDCGRNESGPPTVADFDGDGEPEIGTAGADFYVVFDLECLADPLPEDCRSNGVRWAVPNQDCSSRATGSSVFDFDGDGAAEVVYADETTFRIFAGVDGTILYEDSSHTSNTRMEMPIVVDVDNDGKSEVLVPEPNPSVSGLGGIEVWEDANNNWVRTRRIWNQHAYHVTNIQEDGQVPAIAPRNWDNDRLNNFRQNVQPAGLFDAPDLTVLSIELDCNVVPGELRVIVTVANQGALGVAAGVPVLASAAPGDGGEPVSLGVQRTTTFMLPGQQERLVFEIPFSDTTYVIGATVDDDGEGGASYNECDETNNSLEGEMLSSCLIG